MYALLPMIQAQIAPEDQRGLYMGVLNIFSCMSQLIVALSGPILVRILGDRGATRAQMGVGAVLAGISILVIPRIITRSVPAGEILDHEESIEEEDTKYTEQTLLFAYQRLPLN